VRRGARARALTKSGSAARAAWLVSAGVPLTDVGDLLGHSTVRMTERYAHLAPERVRSAVAVLDEVAASGLSHVRPSPVAG
jgi:integrase